MTFVLAASLVAIGIGGLAGTLAGRSAASRPLSAARKIFGWLLALSVVPVVVHALSTWRVVTGFVDLSVGAGAAGRYPGAVGFAAVAAALVMAGGVSGIRLARRWPVFASLLPVLLFIAYFRVAIPQLQREAPGGGMIIDNMPTIWLFLASIVMTGGLAAFAFFGFQSRTEPAMTDRDRRSQKRIVTYRAREKGDDHVREVDYAAIADALHFACRDLREGRREPIEIIEDGVQIYDRDGIAEACKDLEITLPKPEE